MKELKRVILKLSGEALSGEAKSGYDDALIEALEACKETPVYGGLDVDGGATKLSATQPAEGPVLKVVEFTTMPDGQPGVMLQALKA